MKEKSCKFVNQCNYRVMIPMAGSLPQFRVEYIRRHDLLKATFPVFLSYKFDEYVINMSTFRLKKARSWRQFMEEK